MKRIGMTVLALLAFAGVAFGEMDDKLYNLTVAGAGTNSAAYVLRGELRAVAIDVTAPSTSTVTVASSDGRTLFTLAGIAADAVYNPRAAAHTTAGAAATFLGGGDTNYTANVVYVGQPMASAITVTLVGQNGASVTNNTKVTLIYDR